LIVTTISTVLTKPTTQPYLSYGHTSTTAEAALTTVPTGVTDWVLAELWTATGTGQTATKNTLVGSRAAFVRADGMLVDLDGTLGVSFPTTTNLVPGGNYILAIRHRNHLAVRTIPIILGTGTNPTVDFTLGAAANTNIYVNSTILSNPPEVLVGTVYAMWGGDANSNGRVSYIGLNNDETFLSTTVLGGSTTALSGVYNSADMNMNGRVSYIGLNNDETFLSTTVLGGSTTAKSQHY